MDKRLTAVVVIILAVVIAAAAFMGMRGGEDGGYDATDYSDTDNWLSLPRAEKGVDTFYIYPTTYVDFSEGSKDICDVDNEIMRSGAVGVFQGQATAFQDSTNVFAPFYRQTNISVAMDMEGQEYLDYQHQQQYADVCAALDYYFENLNGGRPFMLAGHSQGSAMLNLVLDEYMEEHPERYERMIAAYVIGFSITQDYLDRNPHLRFAEGATDTGVIVSWNTEGPGNDGHHSIVVMDGAISINPLNWSRDSTYASADENLGSLVEDDSGEWVPVPGFADAQVNTERGVVVCTTASEYYSSPETEPLFGPEALHGMDYGLYYGNLKENVADRIATYLVQRGPPGNRFETPF